MPKITMYFDFISPYAYLAFKVIQRGLVNRVDITYKPILFAGLLNHYGQLGPAEIPYRREWTFLQALWQGREAGIPIRLPKSHPFNPLTLLRLAIAENRSGDPSKETCNKIFEFVWNRGADVSDETELSALSSEINLERKPDDPAVKEQLKTNTEEAIANHVYGVPSFQYNNKIFWGNDSLKMLEAYIDGDPWIDENWSKPDAVTVGITRKK
ncbi:MAG TPA: disulfide bond formation protein DsbA [Betaproteobacteria bacterium]|jgi:2-hydroxychromene-2-carboxylate isomerase|nr:disulfide bond formation protein DsbA [Betaproteobacteria bacterium]HAU82688.1 disulfide bond formation protein DsbA [Betaproteobacteria bacterium]